MRSRLACLSATAVMFAVAVVVGLASSDTRVSAAPSTIVTCDDWEQLVSPPTPNLASYTPITPTRIVDTREALGGFGGVVPGGCTMHLDLSDSLVPLDAGAVALSLTADTDRRGFMTVFPCSASRPERSNLNTRGDAPTPNLVVAVPDERRTVCIYSHVDADLIIDVQGWWDEGSDRFEPLAPRRIHDSREELGRVALAAGGERAIDVAPAHVPDDATAVVINLTATETERAGWMSVYPCGEPVPRASNLNYSAGDTRAVAAIVGIGRPAGGIGQICVTTMSTAHVIVDVVGFYGSAPTFGPAIELHPTQQRIVDTRNATGPWDTPFGAREIRVIDPLAGLERPADAAAVVINAVGLDTVDEGYLTFYPCSEEPPTVSTLNTMPGHEVANLLIVELSAQGTVCVLSHRAGNVVLDLVGVLSVPPGSPLQQLDVSGVDVMPEFHPAGRNYALDCASGLNELAVAAVPHRDRQVWVDGLPVRSGAPLALAVAANDLLSVEVRDTAGAAETYWFRCLPDDFPDLVVDRPGAPTAGWYLTGLGGRGDVGAFTVIFDEFGAPVWYQRAERFPINPQRLADGSIMYDTSDAPGYGVGVDEVATVIGLDGDQLATITTDDPAVFPLDHHELLERPGGWTMVAYRLLDGVDVSVLGSDYGADEFVVDGSIREIAADGTLVWEWNALDHFDVAEVQFPVRFKNFLPDDPVGEVDLIHINSVDEVDDGSGDYVVSARHLDATFRVDRSTGDVAWILSSVPDDGVVVPNKNGAPRLDIIGDPLGGTRRQHDARLNGDILTVFDNRTQTGQPARAVAYRIDETNLTATWLWQIDEPGGRESGGLGSLRVGGDGSRLVNWGALQPMFNEFDSDGNLMLSIRQVPSGNAYRVVKYGPDAFGAEQLRQAVVVEP